MVMAMRPMHYQEFDPPAALRTWVAALWSFEVPPGVVELPQAIPLTGGAILGLNLRGGPLLCFGPRLHPLQSPVRGGDHFVGLHLWPGLHRAWMGPQTPPLREVVRPLAELADPAWVGRISEALRHSPPTSDNLEPLGQALMNRPPPGRADQAVVAAVGRILGSDGRNPVGSLHAEVGLSPSTFRRRFRLEVELSPKELARIRRVRASAVDAVAGDEPAEDRRAAGRDL